MNLITDYDRAVAYVDAHIGRGMVPGLDRIHALLELMGDPHTAYPVIHVAGTNGKTSTSRLATFLCVAHGLTTGTFTSPHLERIEQRFSINGHWLDQTEFTQAVADVAAFADIYEERTGESLTYFELTAATALSLFADQAVDAAVIEVGLGGRLDATNVVRGEVAVITSIGLDHMEFLGDTVTKIAAEKLAILEPGATLVTGPLQPEVLDLATAAAAAMDAPIHVYGRDFRVEGAAPALGGWHVDVEGVHGSYSDIYLPVHGRFQTINLAVAIAAVEGLLDHELDPAAVIDGVAAFTAPGRMEVLATDPLVLLDGAHNRPAFEALAQSLAEEFPTTKWVTVFGAMRDKDVEAMAATLSGRLARVVTTAVDSPRALSAEEAAARVRPVVDVEVGAIEDPRQAIEVAKELAGADGAVLVTGSLYLLGDIRSYLGGHGTR
ncbi:MAG TPA: folylpolyglutamate synthase/dihydrofolate synthase family protein [Acidimicrobiia bacterium]